MSGLNENHKRKILATVQHVDELLAQSLGLLGASRGTLRPRYVADLSPSESHWVESYADKIREQIARLLERFEIDVPPPATLASWALRTNLVMLDIALEDLYPAKMRGYGEIHPAAAGDLTWTLQEVRRLVAQLLAFLAEARRPGEAQPAALQAEPELAATLERLGTIIARHGLVEYHPALNSIVRKLQSHRYEIAVFGRVSSGKSSFINRLLDIGLLPVGTTPITAVPIHIVAGAQPRLQVTFADGAREFPVERLPEFATEQGNPANAKRVVGLEVAVPSARLQNGVAFVDTPGIASLATSGTRLSYAYLPDSDFGVVLVDGHTSLGRDDLELLRALHAAGIPSVVMISKCDLLAPGDVERVVAYTRSAVAEHLGFSLDVVPISSVESWVPRIQAWFEETIRPLVARSRESLAVSLARKVQSLRASLLATLEMRAYRAPADRSRSEEAERVLRPLDESLDEFTRRWEQRLGSTSGWAEEILSRTSARLAQSDEEHGDAAAQVLADAVIETAAGHYRPFLQEYEELASRLSRGVKEPASSQTAPPCTDGYDFPRPSAIPSPAVALLSDIRIPKPGAVSRMSAALRTRHFRRQLEEKAGPALEQVLEELRPRLRHWLSSTLAALRENYRLRTDPMRYRGPAGARETSAAERGRLEEDIEFLREPAAAQAPRVAGPTSRASREPSPC